MIGPSAKFIQKLANRPYDLKWIERIKKEFYIYSQLTYPVPTSFSDKHWEKILEIPTVRDRVRLWNFMAFIEDEEKMQLFRKERKIQSIKEFNKTQAEIFENGGMGYGTGLYELMFSPFRSDIETLADSRQYIAQRLQDQPKIALDFQFISAKEIPLNGKLLKNLNSFLSYNRYKMQNPFPLSLVNVYRTYPRVKQKFKNIGLINRSESSHSVLLPEVYSDNPLINETKNKEIVYLSRHAKDFLDGPLNQYAFILPVTFDTNRESIYGAREGGFRLMSLPLNKYVKWKSGRKYFSLKKIQKMLEIVSRTGGDWHRALHENIAEYHLLSHEENKAWGFYYHTMIDRVEEDDIVDNIELAFDD